MSVTPLTGDVRMEHIYANDRYREQQGGVAAAGMAGRHDVQLWLFKRERPESLLPEEIEDEDAE